MIRRLYIFILTACCTAFGQAPQTSVYTFQAWKEQQVLEAQNQVLRSTTHLNQLKTGRQLTPDSSKEIPKLLNGRIKKSEGDPVSQSERELKRAQESQQAASSLEFEDYINIYLPTLQDQPEALAKVVEKLSKEELIEVVKNLVAKSTKPVDAKRNSGSVARVFDRNDTN